MTAHRAATTGGAFHVRDSWYARRDTEGSVTLWSGVGQEEITLPAKVWCHLVASLSAGGYSDGTLAAATALHKGAP